MDAGQIITAVLTFAGTLLVTGIGLWQWRRTREQEVESEFRANRVKALGEVWTSLADADEHLRASFRGTEGAADAPELREHVVRVNLLLLRQTPFLEGDEQEMAQKFVHRLIELNTLVGLETPESASTRHQLATTRADLPNVGLMAAAANELDSLRKAFADRYSAVMKGERP